jgi:hypothetical protein
MGKVIRLTESDLTRLVRKVIKEQSDSNKQNTHRYDAGTQSPGFEKFLENPMDEEISNGLLNQLRNDPFGKGKITIIFNGQKFKEPGAFMFKIQSDSKSGKCYEITNYDYNNRFILNTQIKITANAVKCKKQTTTGTQPVNPTTGTQPVNPKPKPKPKPKKFCKWEPNQGKNEIINSDNIKASAEEQIKSFQRWCSRNNLWFREYTDGTKSKCSDKHIDGKWGCCTSTCYNNFARRRERPPASSPGKGQMFTQPYKGPIS